MTVGKVLVSSEVVFMGDNQYDADKTDMLDMQKIIPSKKRATNGYSDTSSRKSGTKERDTLTGSQRVSLNSSQKMFLRPQDDKHDDTYRENSAVNIEVSSASRSQAS